VSTTSTASSSTDGPEPDGTGPAPSPGAGTTDPAGPAAAPPAAAAQPDPGRRAFFKSFSRQAFTTAAQVVGMANAVSSATTNVAVGVVGLAMDPDAAAERIAAPAAPAQPAAVTPTAPEVARAPVGYRSPYRLDGDVLYLLDQRGLPDRLDEQICRRGSDVAFYLRVMAVRGGPIVGQLAAYGLAMTAKEFAPRTWHARQAEWKRVCRALMAARTGNRMLRFAIDRMSAVHDQFGPDVEPLAVAAAVRAEADTLTTDAQLDHAAIARTLAELLPRPAERPLSLLVHGAPGTSTGGHIGTALNAITLLAQEELRIKVYVTETRPYLEGARLATWELGPTGVETVVIPDAAVGYVLDTLPVDAVLLGADWIASNGDTSNTAGSRVIAEVAASARRGPVPVYVAAPATTIDPAMATGEGIPIELRPGREIVTHLTGWKPERPSALLPSQDVIPAARITAIVTELGALVPERDTLIEASRTRGARRATLAPAYVPPAVMAAASTADDGPPTPDGRAPGSPDDDDADDATAEGSL
jgi:methylthioribose-1-phosphate isomerase